MKSNYSKQGNSLVFVLIFIAILSIGMASILKHSSGQRSTANASHDQVIAKQAASEGLQIVKKQVVDSIRYFSEMKLTNATSVQKAFADYANNYSDKFITHDTDEDYPAVPSSFIDFARSGGFQSTELKPQWTSDNITYKFSVRCLKDESNRGGNSVKNPSAAYFRGDIDGCPMDALGMKALPSDNIAISEYYRTKWSSTPTSANGSWPSGKTAYDNWVKLPKRIEIVVSARKDNSISTIREIATIEPVMLNDYAFALGKINNPDPKKPFTLFGNQFFGRVHFDVDPSTLSQTSDGQPYRIRLNAETDGFAFYRPFTAVGGLHVDAIDSLTDANVAPYVGNSDNKIEFFAGYDTSAPAINIPDQIKNSVAAAQKIPDSDSHLRFQNPKCSLEVKSGASPKAQVNCPATSDLAAVNKQIDLSAYSATSLVFDNSVTVKQSLIKTPIAVYSAGDIVFAGVVAYDAATNPAQAGRVFIPSLNKNATPDNVVHPLDIAASGNMGPIGMPALHQNHAALAQWVANGDISIDATQAIPMNPLALDEYGNGSAFEMPNAGDKTLLAGQKVNANDGRMMLIDGKIQAAGKFNVITDPNKTFDDAHNLDSAKNFGDLVMRGGVTVGEITQFKRSYTGGNCTEYGGCFQGFGKVDSWFDNRSDFSSKFSNQAQLLGQLNWSTISYENFESGSLFGRVSGDLVAANTDEDMPADGGEFVVHH
ncbi:MAG: pilus assembly PilX N-terminal domain-containing protein [Deltaproteobacteria bacterium]|nr:pilus assembly PilX N-terminal domain-containing protein [Deltaproteobacteria bacterium]